MVFFVVQIGLLHITHYIIITSSSGSADSWRSRDEPGPLWLSSSCQGPSPGASQARQWPEGWPPQRTLRSPYEGSTPWALCRSWPVYGGGGGVMGVAKVHATPYPSFGFTGDLAAEFSVWCAHDLEYPGQLVDVFSQAFGQEWIWITMAPLTHPTFTYPLTPSTYRHPPTPLTPSLLHTITMPRPSHLSRSASSSA